MNWIFEVCKHTPQTWCKQAKQALQISACEQAPQNCAGQQQAGSTDLCKQAPPMNSKVNSAAILVIVVARESMGSWSYFKLQERGISSATLRWKILQYEKQYLCFPVTGLSSLSSPARFLAEAKLLDVHEHGSWWWRTLLSLKKLNSFAKPKLLLVVAAAPYFPSVNTLLLLLLRDRFTSSRAGRAAREEWALLLTHDSTTNFFKQFLISSKNLLPNSITFFFDDCTESLSLALVSRDIWLTTGHDREPTAQEELLFSSSSSSSSSWMARWAENFIQWH